MAEDIGEVVEAVNDAIKEGTPHRSHLDISIEEDTSKLYKERWLWNGPYEPSEWIDEKNDIGYD